MAALPVPSPADLAGGRRFLLEIDRRLERLDRAILISDFNQQAGRSSRGPERWQLARSALLSDPALLPWVRSARESRWPARLARELELLERIALEARVEESPEVVRLRNELARRVVRFRPLWKGRRVDRVIPRRALREDPDPEVRRRGYYAEEELHRSLEAPLRTLIELRNERAREAGFRDLSEMRLGFSGIRPDEFDGLCEEVLRTAPGALRALRDRRDRSEADHGWHPWDVAYARERLARPPDALFPKGRMLPRILQAVARWGFRTGSMHFRVVFHDLPAGGLTLAPDPPRDVRILVHPVGGWSAYHVMFHEVGHAVQSSLVRVPGHLTLWHENVPGFGGYHEGIGALFEEIPRDGAWLAGMGVERPLASEFARVRREGELGDAVSTVLWAQTEMELYRHPGKDPVPALERRRRQLYGFDEYAPPSFADSFWVDLPIYSPNYLFAKLFHHQLAETIRSTLGEPLWPNRRVGPWLTRHWFRDGSLFDWKPRIREVSGSPFGAGAFQRAMRDLGA